MRRDSIEVFVSDALLTNVRFYAAVHQPEAEKRTVEPVAQDQPATEFHLTVRIADHFYVVVKSERKQ